MTHDANHSPGPWKVSGCQLGEILLIEHGDIDTFAPFIGSVYSDSGRLPQAANAALICAAPELLAQLRQANNQLQYLTPEKFDDEDHEANWTRMLTNIENAIAKAEGRD